MICNNIHNKRTQRNLSQEALARKAGVSLQTVQNGEGGRSITATTARKLAGALGCKVAEL